MSDDLGWEPMALVADGLDHAAAIRPQAADQKLPWHHPDRCSHPTVSV
jgi:hypothetical protein